MGKSRLQWVGCASIILLSFYVYLQFRFIWYDVVRQLHNPRMLSSKLTVQGNVTFTVKTAEPVNRVREQDIYNEEIGEEISMSEMPEEPEAMIWTGMGTLTQLMGVHFVITYHVTENIRTDYQGLTEIALRLQNMGIRGVPRQAWRIYFNSIRPVLQGVMDCGLAVRHTDGDLYYITPYKTFSPLGAESAVTCTMRVGDHVVARTDIFPNWFVAMEGCTTERLVSTMGESLDFVDAFETPQQWKRGKADRFNPYTAAERFQIHSRIRDLNGARSHVIPTPIYVKEISTLKMDSPLTGWVVVANDDLKNEVKMLSEALQLRIVKQCPESRFIQLMKRAGASLDPEEYELEVNTQAQIIKISANQAAGAFYGCQSLLSLLAAGDGKIASIQIKDMPRFPHRGLLLDVARNFLPVPSVLKLLDAMAMYKLNVLHLHLTDNEGWRLEIPGIPELTEIGSKRCFDPLQNSCLLPSFGSGPTSETSGSGHYAVDDYKKILQYARDRHIVVVPEVAMPGHARAAIQSMNHRERKMADKSHAYLQSYMLIDKKLNITSPGKWRNSAMNPCIDTTYNFVEKVVREIAVLHRDIQPLMTFHIGGDDVIAGSWHRSEACKQLFPNESDSARKLEWRVKKYFIKRVKAILTQKHLLMAASGIGLLDETDWPFKKKDIGTNTSVIYATSYHTSWEAGLDKRPYQLANAGYKTVVSMENHLSLDQPYEPDPEERGVSKASRFLSTNTVFRFQPDDLYGNRAVTMDGLLVDRKMMCQLTRSECPALIKKENIIGIQASLWSEVIRNERQLHYMAFPRILAFAERAWHRAGWETEADDLEKNKREDWETFANALGYKELPRLEKLGIQHRVPPPGASVHKLSGQEGFLLINTLYPGLRVEMFDDVSELWKPVRNKSRLTYRQDTVLLRTSTLHLNRTSRVVTLKTGLKPPPETQL